MKKVISLVTLLVISVTLFSQDVLVLKHTNYTSHFSKSKKYPVMVEWWETKAKVSCPNPLPRKDAFQPDPQAIVETDIKADYVGSGYDRGHNMNAEDNRCDKQGMDESFYFSNMTPQVPQLNRGVWKIWETTIRQESQKWPLRIYCGGIYTNPINSHSIGIPSYCWKLVINLKTHLILHVLLFKNDDSNSVQRISFSDLKKMLNYTVDFKTN